MNQNVIRTLRIVSTTEGVDQTTASLNKLQVAHEGVAKSAGASATVTDISTKNQLSMAQALERAERRFNSTLRAQQDFEKVQRQMNLAVAQNPALQERANAVIAQARVHFDQASRSQRAFSTIANDLNSRVGASVGVLGTFGQVLSNMGTGGIAAAAILGVLATAIAVVATESARMGDRAIAIRQFSEATGISAAQMSALRHAGAEFGVTGEDLSNSFTRLTGQLNDATRASGSLYEDVRQVSSGLADQLQQSRTTVEGIDALAAAYRRAETDAQRVVIARAAFGRGGITQGPVLGAIADAGGLNNLVQQMGRLGEATDSQNARWARMRAETVEMEHRARNILASIFTERGLAVAREAAEHMLNVAQAAERAAAVGPGVLQAISDNARENRRLGGQPAGPRASTDPLDIARRRIASGEGAENLAANPQAVESWNNLADALSKTATQAQQVSKTQRELQNDAAATARLAQERVGLLGSAATAEDHRIARLATLRSALLDNKLAETDYNRAVAVTNAETRASRIQETVSALGSAATVTEQYQAQVAKLNVQLVSGKISQETFNRAVAGLDLEQNLQRQRDTISALGDAATETQKYQLRVSELQQQLDRGAISQETFTRAVQNANPIYKQFKDTLEELGTTFASAMLSGKSGAEALNASLKAVTNTATNATIKNLISGDLEKAAISASIAVVSFAAQALFGGKSEKQKQAEADARQAFIAGNQRQNQFNFASATIGLDTSTRAGALAALEVQAQQERAAEAAAGGQAMAELESNLRLRRLAIDKDFDQKELEAREQARASMLDLQRQINELTGQGFLNEFADLFKTVEEGRRNATLLGTGTDLIDRFFGIKAQKIIDDAGLVGDAFTSLVTTFPQLSGVVHEATKSVQDQIAAQNKLNDIAKSIVNYVNSLNSGGTYLSPQATLASAQAAYASQLALAQGGNLDAQSTITQYADDLIKAAREFYGSTTAFQAIFDQVKTQLLALPAVQAADDPVVVALRDVVAAVNETTGSVDSGNALLNVIQTYTNATQANTASQVSLQATQNSLITTANTLEGTTHSLLNSINSLISNGNAQLVAMTNVQNTIHGDNLTIVNRLDTIALNTAKTVRNTYLSAPSGDPNTTGVRQNVTGQGFAEGGVASAGMLAIFGEHHPWGPFAMRTREPVTFSPGFPTGAGNDNSRLIADALASLVPLLERIARITGASGEEISDEVRNVKDSVEGLRREIQHAA